MENKNKSCDLEIDLLKRKYNDIENLGKIEKFSDFPLSHKTMCGLTDLKYINPTDIQGECIGLALQGRDIVGSAITGSGKTLCFLIPVLERLYINKWSSIDGVGAVIISPTRELAYQIFEVLKGVGKYHDFSAGLIIGGKNLKFERKRMDRCNILVCTPGRLLQHMDENPLFNASNLQVLVLDEADRCLDMGFEKTMNAILEHFQNDKQTLIFSATQTQSVKDLARLNLNNAAYVIPKKIDTTVPLLLQQSYVVVPLEEKLTVLWSFIKNHLKQKCIVFLASCKQVKYVNELFCKLRVGTTLLALYGSLHQDRRICIYNEFAKKNNVVLFATDVASRGLDFPLVDWVIQLDCPENVEQYIHRAGRSARNKQRGESLLIITPPECSMIDELKRKSIDIKQIQIDARKLFFPHVKVEGILAKYADLKETAKRAFLAYVKAVYNMKNKNIFNVNSLNLDKFAKSLGLPITPRIRFIEKRQKHLAKNTKITTKDDVSCNDFDKTHSSDESESEELFTIKRRDDAANDELVEIDLTNTKRDKFVTRVSQAKKLLKKQILPNTKRKFNEDGSEIVNPQTEFFSEVSISGRPDKLISRMNVNTGKKLILENDKRRKQKSNEVVENKPKHKKTTKDKNDTFSRCVGLEDITELPTNSANSKHKRKEDVSCKESHLKQKPSPELTVEDTEIIAKNILKNSFNKTFEN